MTGPTKDSEKRQPAAKDVEPEIELIEDDDEASLPDADDAGTISFDAASDSLAAGREAVLHYVKLAPSRPGVYRMIDGRGDVLYVGKAKNIKKRITAYARPTGLDTRIERMIAATRTLEFVVTRTETEALLLEANLIKRLRPRFNVLLRDDKSFPYILITSDHWAPQILKHRGARSRPGRYYGPFASVWAVNRTINALQRAFLLRSCSDGFFENRTRPCLLYQIKRCSAPCTKEIDFAGYAALVGDANAFLSGRSKSVKDDLVGAMEEASTALDFEHAAIYRDRLSALSAIQSQQGINPRTVVEADVFAVHQQGGFTCVEVFFFRTGQNWGNRAYFPKADKSLGSDEVLAAFLAQFYDDKPPPRLILISHKIDDQALLAAALTTRSGHKVEISLPQRGEKKDLMAHALSNAREALGRKLAETSSQQRLLTQLAETFALPRPPRRIEVFDNSHIQGTNAVGAMIVAGAEGFRRKDYRKFNIRSTALTPGDDFAMMREVLERRFQRLMDEAPRNGDLLPEGEREPADEPDESPWPDLVLIDGGLGQRNAAREVLQKLGGDEDRQRHPAQPQATAENGLGEHAADHNRHRGDPGIGQDIGQRARVRPHTTRRRGGSRVHDRVPGPTIAPRHDGCETRHMHSSAALRHSLAGTSPARFVVMLRRPRPPREKIRKSAAPSRR